MSTTSRFFHAKRALVALLEASPALQGVHVSYGDPGSAVQHECVVVGGVDAGNQEWGPYGNRARDEEFDVSLFVVVARPGDDQSAADTRAEEILGACEDAVREDPGLGVDGVWDAQLRPLRAREGFLDEGRVCQVDCAVHVMARIGGRL